MDYSGVPNDQEALVGASPWGSSSPRAGRTPYAPSTPNMNVPDSPTQTPSHQHQHTGSQDSISANPFATEASTTAEGLPEPAIQQDQVEGLATPAQQQARDQSLQQSQSTQQPHPQMRPAAARYHSNKQHRPVPAYKLQAKVTALERTGRKDPVIRFDVYVSPCDLRFQPSTDSCRQIFQSSARPSSAMSDVLIQNSSSLPTISSPRIRKHLFLLFRLPSLRPVLAPTRMKLESRTQYSAG
jgi:hypothetical protein